MARAKKSEILNRFVKVRDADVKKIAEWAMKAKGDRTAKEFAELCGVSPSTMTRLLKGENSTASSDELIVAIAMEAVPQIGPVFMELIHAQGLELPKEQEMNEEEKRVRYLRAKMDVQTTYDQLKFQNHLAQAVSIDKSKPIEVEIERICREAIQNEIIARGFQVAKIEAPRFETYGAAMMFDFGLATDALKSDMIDQWYFDVKVQYRTSRIFQHIFDRVFSVAYAQRPLEKGIKLSVIVTDENSFDEIRRNLRRITVRDAISVLWIDLMERAVKAEYVIPNPSGQFVGQFFSEPGPLSYQMDFMDLEDLIYKE